jgi:microcystin-dependent protein
MIDFPSSPTVGQLYTAPNGVIYQWNGTLWLTNSAGGAGAVQAAGGTFTPATGADAVINFATIISGNSGNWLNPATGRYTPPAGRYFIQCTNGVQAPSGGNGTWALVPRKNGVRIPNEGANASGGPLFSIPITVGIYVDANGTDYFDWVANCASAGMAAQGGQFTAFPLSGMQGPPGPLPAQFGDFCAYTQAATITATTAVAIPTTILSGNSGNWYNPTTGRYTPPAGRYFIRASMTVPNTTSAVGLQLNLRKNGANLPGAFGGQVPGNAGWWGDPAQAAIVDANGTDYFDFTVYAGGAQTGAIQFMAFPIMGLAGPPGPAGPPGNPGVGDFWAYNSANLTPPANANTVLVANTVGTGNASGAYSPASGRFTPPAGRYFIFSTCVAAASGPLQFFTVLRKNGVPIPGATSAETPSTANYFSTAKLNVLVDANGTDYFDVTINPNAAGAAVTFFNFGAAPLNGLTGPPGPPGPGGPLQIGTGVVADFAGDVAPIGWYICDGAAKDTTTDAALFAVIGYKYGGSGSSFNLPDCRGRVTAGLDPAGTAGRLTTAGSGVDGKTLGAAGGAQNHALTLANMPAGVTFFTAYGPQYSSAGGNASPTNWLYNSDGAQATIGLVQPTIIMNRIIKA